jgi:CDGSH-type Zn-finger protein
VKDPIFGAKNYYWCSCGMSKSQPFCDSSHAGTAFKPIKFSLDQKVPEMHVCGCKLSTNAPFCDGQTCKMLVSGDKFEVEETLPQDSAKL